MDSASCRRHYWQLGLSTSWPLQLVTWCWNPLYEVLEVIHDPSIFWQFAVSVAFAIEAFLHVLAKDPVAPVHTRTPFTLLILPTQVVAKGSSVLFG